MSLSVLYRFYTKFVLLFRDAAVSIQQLRVVCSHFRSVQTSPLLKNRRKRKMSVSHRPLSDFFKGGGVCTQPVSFVAASRPCRM